MKKEYITPLATKVSYLVEQPILATSLPVSDGAGDDQWSNRRDEEFSTEWEE